MLHKGGFKMIVLIMCICAIIIIYAIGYAVWRDEFPDWYIQFVAGCLLAITLIFLGYSVPTGVNYIDTSVSRAQFYSVQKSINAARERGETIENAAMQQNIIDCNSWLAEAKYYRSSIFKYYVPKFIDTMIEIK
jgi:hypothetical protein